MLLMLMMFLQFEVNLIWYRLPSCISDIRSFPSTCALSRRASEVTKWDSALNGARDTSFLRVSCAVVSA